MTKQLTAGERPVLEPDAIFAADGKQVWPPREERKFYIFPIVNEHPLFVEYDLT